uniref:Pectinesterase n=1 Tax=Kalanchoe fedtschenkoi TaxID=63787 RepID=A0A7N1A9L2_KALFE
MALTTLNAIPFSLRSVITLILLFHFSSTSVESLSSSSFTHSKLRSGMQAASRSVNSSIIYKTIQVAQKVRSTALQQIAQADKGFNNASAAISDCVDLLDDSIDHLYSIAATQNLYGVKSSPSCNRNINACSALSAILANQETCMEGLLDYYMDNKNNNIAKKTLRAGIDQLNPLLSQMILMAANDHLSGQLRTIAAEDDPSWAAELENYNNKNFVNNVSEQLSVANSKVTVALDGSGDYRSIAAAVDAAPSNSNKKFFIHVKRGVYHEYVVIPTSKRNVVMMGDGIGATVIRGSRNHRRDRINTFRTATFAVAGCGFMAKNITFENTAGPTGDQAVALLANANNLVFYGCAFKGYQDTLYAKSGLQFYRECEIHGTIDFIFGDAAAVFQKCQIIVRKPLPSQYNTVTAQGRTLACSATGYSFHDCSFTAEDDLPASTRTYLGRPWEPYSRTVVMKSRLGPLIHPSGWSPWNDKMRCLDTLYYGEYDNSGVGSDVKGRVKWPGFHPRMSRKKADKFTVGKFILGDKWLPSTGVIYDPDL